MNVEALAEYLKERRSQGNLYLVRRLSVMQTFLLYAALICRHSALF